jgi:hypothetical protein
MVSGVRARRAPAAAHLRVRVQCRRVDACRGAHGARGDRDRVITGVTRGLFDVSVGAWRRRPV